MNNNQLRNLTFAIAATALAGCGSSGPASQLPLAPLVASVTATKNPQVATYSVTPHKAANITVKFGEDANYGFVTSENRQDTAETAVPILVAGMKANTTYHMRAYVVYDDGSAQTDIDRTFTTGALPTLPTVQVTSTSGMTPQPGVELVDAILGKGATPFVTDLAGNIIWSYVVPDASADTFVTPIKLLANGHFALIAAPQATGGNGNDLNVFREIDLAGNTIRQITMNDLNASLPAAGFNITLGFFSHDFAVLPNGHYLVMATTNKYFTNVVGYPGSTSVIGDVIVDLDQNFKPVWLWNEFDYFDVNRHPMGFPDWTHSNAVAYSPDDGNFIVSIRHQNWIVKVDYRDGAGTGKVLWKLGEGGDFALKGGTDPTDWFYAQHDANFVSSNTTGSFTLALHDNGDDRMFPSTVTCGSAGAPPCLYTTIPIMQVDENAKTASFTFHDILPANRYSSFAGSTRVLPNANIEYNLASVNGSAQVVEETPTATPQVVWEMQLPGTQTYRSFRIPSLYPGVQW